MKNMPVLTKGTVLAVYLLILLDAGGYKSHTTFFLLFISLLYICNVIVRKGCLFLGNKQSFFGKCLILSGGVLSVFTGIDKGESIYGLLRLITILAAGAAVHQMKDTEKRFLLKTIPITGLSLLIGSFLYTFSCFRGWISSGGRINGPFEYSNTMALFLFLGIISSEHLYGKGKRVIQAALLIGLLGTGSRTVFVILCGYLIFCFVRYKGKNKYILVFFLGLVGFVCLISVSGRNLYGIGRFLKLNISASTFQGRLLYWEDAVRMLMKRPGGLGYMGYFYFQQSEQTGVYSVRFVHNDWIQWILDYGVLSGIGLALYLYQQCWKRKMPDLDRELMCVIAICSFFDFHLQFFSIIIVFLLLIPKGDLTWRCDGNKGYNQRYKYGLFALTGISFCIFISSGIADYYANLKDYGKAVRWNLLSAQYKQEYLLQSQDLKTAAIYADRLIDNNKYLYVAYLIRSNAAAQNRQLDGFIANRRQVLKLRKYKIDEYEDYFEILFNWYLNAYEKKDRQEMEKCLAAMKEIPELIVKVKKETSLRAYRIQEKPNLIFNREYMNLLKRLGGNY